jgi:hypothetical protein
MTWPDPGGAPLSLLQVDTQVVVLPREEVTGRTPPVPPLMRLQRMTATGPVDLTGAFRLTLGGNVVFDGFDRVRTAGDVGPAQDYLLTVAGDPVLRPELAGGYVFTVPADPAQWPVQVAVRLLPGPAYPYNQHVPVVRGRVLRAGADPDAVPDAIVVVSETAAGTVLARCAADHAGRFSAGVPRYRSIRTRTPRAVEVRATAPDGTAGTTVPLLPEDFHRPLHLTIP